jgi:putative tryptophan/tyrosine transport system substrate-binding protein
MRLLAVLLLVVLITAPLAVNASQSEKLYRIGMLERTSPTINAANIEAFRQGMRELGHVEGESFIIDYRSADGHDDRFPALASELVRSKVDAIVTRGTPAALAAKNATTTIPVIITGIGDPVGQGVVASLARPGANVTGLSAAVTDIYPKRVQLLTELVPKATRIGVLLNMSNPALPPQWREVERASRSRGLEPQLLDVRKVGDLEPAFDMAVRQRVDALVVGIDTLDTGEPAAHRGSCGEAPPARDVRVDGIRRRVDLLWRGLSRDVSPRGDLRAQNSEGRREAG